MGQETKVENNRVTSPPPPASGLYASDGCNIWLFVLRPLLSDPYEHVRDEVKENVTSFGIKRDCNWLDLDKVSLKLASKNLLRSKLKPCIKIFSVLC